MKELSKPGKPLAKSLTEAATLSGIAILLQIGIQLMTGLLVTPLVIRGLGRELYGAWAMIQQTLGYVGLVDLRATGALKLTLAKTQHEDDPIPKRREVGAALGALALLAPGLVLAGACAVWLGPVFVRVGPDFSATVRWALAIGIVAVIVGELASVPANVLRGMNLEYKAMGLAALVLLLTSVLNLLAVVLGLGLTGLAMANLTGVTAAGVIRMRIARRFVPWFGAESAPRDVQKRYWKQTIWLSVGVAGQLLQNGSEVLLIGIIAGPTAAAVYAVTGMVLRLVSEPLLGAIAAANPGLGGLCGTAEWRRLEGARLEIKLMGLAVLLVVTSGVLALNEAFLKLWVGPDYFGGDALNALLCANVIVNVLLRTDAMIADAALRVKEKAFVFIAAGVGGLALGAALAEAFGLWGLALGVLTGRLCTFIALSHIVAGVSGERARRHWFGLMRLLGVGGALGAFWWFARIRESALSMFPVWVLTVGVVSGLTIWFLGLAEAQRGRLSSRMSLQAAAILRRSAVPK